MQTVVDDVPRLQIIDKVVGVPMQKRPSTTKVQQPAAMPQSEGIDLRLHARFQKPVEVPPIEGIDQCLLSPVQEPVYVPLALTPESVVSPSERAD
ncbi:MAG: hypothetical protein ACKPKO_59780, partial [Candidatus Fonsibacter sp.]